MQYLLSVRCGLCLLVKIVLYDWDTGGFGISAGWLWCLGLSRFVALPRLCWRVRSQSFSDGGLGEA